MYGPAALDAQQRALADAAKRSREAEGSSRQIGFVGAKKADDARPAKDGKWDSRTQDSRGSSREQGRYRGKEKGRERDGDRHRDKHAASRREKERDHHRDRY